MAIIITPEYLAKDNTETGHQKAVFCWARNIETVTKYPDIVWAFAVPNGGFRHKAVANQLRAEGVKSGVPDIWLPIRRGEWCGLVVELKRIKTARSITMKAKSAGIVSDAQTEWLDFLKSQGYGTAVCYGWIAARDMIISYLTYKG